MTTALLSGGRALLAGGRALLVTSAPSGGGSGSTGISSVALHGGGQSNAVYANDYDGALIAMAQAVAFYLGASSYAQQSSNGNTDIGGAGSYEYSNDGFAYFLTNTSGLTAAAAASAPLSANGTLYINWVSALTSQQKAAIKAIVWYWGETDSILYDEAQKSIIEAALMNLAGQVRAAIGQTAAQLPLILFGPPYGGGQGAAMMREAWAELAANPANNAVWAVQQTYDTISRNEAWNGVTGVSSGGNTDGGHRSAIDNVVLYKRGALAVARAILASNGLSAALIPSALGTGLGPAITGASLSGTTLTLTITHDGGTDLIVPLLASQGVGFAVMDGGTIGSPGNIIQATSCTRVNATTLSVTLASAPSNAASACRLMYPWPGEYWTVQPDTEIGRGCAVTDNFSTVAKPTGFDINASLGTGWAANMPLRSPVTVTGSGSSAVAEYGMAL